MAAGANAYTIRTDLDWDELREVFRQRMFTRRYFSLKWKPVKTDNPGDVLGVICVAPLWADLLTPEHHKDKVVAGTTVVLVKQEASSAGLVATLQLDHYNTVMGMISGSGALRRQLRHVVEGVLERDPGADIAAADS